MRSSIRFFSAVLFFTVVACLSSPAQATFSTAGGGGFWGPGLCENMHGWSDELVGQVTIVATSNEVRVRQFILQSSFTISRITTVLGDGPYSATFNFGIYSASGNLLLDSGAFNGSYSAIGTVQTLTITSVTLAAGTYFYAQTASSSSVSPLGVGSFASQLIVADSIANATTPRFAIAANAASGGALPSTLGTLTTEGSNAAGTGIAFFEP
jgi:hypothetical protein